jgi:Zn-dependent M28 family amino/carboxypeptidase
MEDRLSESSNKDYIMRLAAAFSALLLCSTASQAFAASDAPGGGIDAAAISQHIKILASDAFEGRGPATPGETKAITYIIEQYKKAGLKPGGDSKGPWGAWVQDVPLARFQVTAPTFSLTAGGQAAPLVASEQIVARTLLPVDHVSIKDAPLVFIGYGVQAPERRWDDFKGVDLHGKIAVVLINDPDYEADLGGRFDGKSETYYGRWTYKYEEAARQGALGILIVHETGPAAYGWNTVKNSNSNAQFDIVSDDPTKAHTQLEGWIQRDVAVDLFRRSGLDFEAMKKAAQSEDFHPVELKGASLSADYGVEHSQIVTYNVIGRVPGAVRPNETLIYSAHWDHLGVGQPDAAGHRIYNGAVDNASGVAALLEMGRVFAAGPAPQRSVVFIAVTAEEKGLLGSAYYAAHPVYPLATTVADLNMDGFGVHGPARNISISGAGQLTLLDDLIDRAKTRQDRYFTPDPSPEAGHFFRADHFSFAKAGVPAITLSAGYDLVNGGLAAGKVFQDDYVAHKYHQPGDQWSADWDLSGEALDATLYYDLGRDLANSDEWPRWKDGSEFKAARDSTASARR